MSDFAYVRAHSLDEALALQIRNIATIGGNVANAVFHATGEWHHTLPLTLERVLLSRELHPGRGEVACRRALGFQEIAR